MKLDLRSDTVTQPTEAMWQAMRNAPLGDDVFGDDPTVNELESKVAAMFGMEAAMFCTSGTMTNQIALMCYLGPGEEVILHKDSHIYLYEGGGIMANTGASVNLLTGAKGHITPQQIVEAIKPDNYHYPISKLVSLENTMNKAGGTCYEMEDIIAIRKTCVENGLKLHLDGARLANAIVAKNQEWKDFGHNFDSISLCLSKGLGAPIGSVLVGNTAFIKKAKRIRKRIGGGWRQAGMLAAAAIYALDNHVHRLSEDHLRAQKIAQLISSKTWIDYVYPVETNIVIAQVKDISENEIVAKLADNGILAVTFGPKLIRFVTHLNFEDSQLLAFEDYLKQ